MFKIPLDDVHFLKNYFFVQPLQCQSLGGFVPL